MPPRHWRRSWQPRRTPGHYDELRAADGTLRPSWGEFFEHLGPGGFADLPRRRATIERQVRDDGITYNVYSEDGRGERPWSLDLLPVPA